MSISCKSCDSIEIVKNGNSYGKQRYKCKECGLNFVLGDKRIKYGAQDRFKVLKLYLENCGIRSIERLTGIRNRQISLWIEEYSSKIRDELTKSAKDMKSIKDISIVEIDEICTYVKKAKKWRIIYLYMDCC